MSAAMLMINRTVVANSIILSFWLVVSLGSLCLCVYISLTLGKLNKISSRGFLIHKNTTASATIILSKNNI
jgi:hypothetical protein